MVYTFITLSRAYNGVRREELWLGVKAFALWIRSHGFELQQRPLVILGRASSHYCSCVSSKTKSL